MNNNRKILIANLVAAVLAIASIITLCVGNFFALNIGINVDKNLIETFTGDSEDLDIALFEGVDIKIPLSFEVKSALLLKSITSSASDTAQSFIKNQVDLALTSLFTAVDQMVKAISAVLINTVVEEAKTEIISQLKNDLGTDNITDEQVYAELQTAYGISKNDIEGLKTDVSDTLSALLDGGTGSASQTLAQSQTLDKLISVYAEQALKDELGEGTYTQAQIDAKKAAIKDDITQQLDNTIDEIAIDDRFNKDSLIVWMLNKIDDSLNLQSIDDAKDFIAQKIKDALGDNATSALHTVLKTLGIFLLIVIAGWAYLLLKLLFKLFARNKSVGMFVPKLLGWLPYVVFVGIPNLLFKSLNTIATKFSNQLQLDAEAVNNLKQYASFITIKFSALTWVSAAAVLALIIIWFPYRKWRKEAKKNK